MIIIIVRIGDMYDIISDILKRFEEYKIKNNRYPNCIIVNKYVYDIIVRQCNKEDFDFQIQILVDEEKTEKLNWESKQYNQLDDEERTEGFCMIEEEMRYIELRNLQPR